MNIEADEIFITDNGNEINASGNVRIETKTLQAISDNSTYNKELDQIKSSGNIIVKDQLKNHYYFENIITDKNFNNALGSNVKIRMNDGSRIVGRLFSRVGSSVNQISNAIYTPCIKDNYIIKNCPGWKLNANKVIHDETKQTIYYQNATLSILNFPVLYTPYFSHPDPSVNKRSGFLMPSITSDNILGETISIPIFYDIASNHDLTFTPVFQSKVDDYYALNYRHLTKNHNFNLDSSISNNASNTGTGNHLFINGKIKNPYGKFDYAIQTTNDDTYMRKNHINNLTVLTSGLNFTKEMDNSYLDFSTYIYKHLNNSSNQKWEYTYPIINYDIHNYKDPLIGQTWKINNSFLNYRDINKNNNHQISSEFTSTSTSIYRKIGLKFENTIKSRIIYFTDSANDFNQLRIFPQISNKISYPLVKTDEKKSQLLEPIIMPIFAPYNNYANDQDISNSNIFSENRETSLSQWESGPRVNYGFNWLINYNNFLINSTFGQSAKINKERDDSDNEISNYFIGNTIDFGNKGYIKTDMTLDRKKMYLKDNNINASINYKKYKFGFDYDYETSNRIKTSEQISAGTKIQLIKDTHLIASIRKSLMTEKSIGNAFGLHYENDCLAINFDYFKDFTAVNDIKNSRGFSFTVTLKPFGTTKQQGKTRNFGPEL
ncbi:hypothetical protein OA527_03700 [Pelagibacteraceae bacterium]|nr:hypothetical protein [Pelagibacteraceae bacterium]